MSELIKSTAGQSLDEQIRYAQVLSDSDLLPKSFQGKPANVLMAIEYGRSLDLTPIQAIQEIVVIQGKPTASANLIGALVRKAGHSLRVRVDAQQLVAVAQIVRKDDPEFTYETRWDMDRAKRAGLASKDNWKNYSEAMLKARAITEVAREACPEALMGIQYTSEELEASPQPIRIDPAVAGEEVVDAEPVGEWGDMLAAVTTRDELNPLWAQIPADAKTPDLQRAFAAKAAELDGDDQ